MIEANVKRLVFISHANPEDNDFTLWLASRLACHGYTVWSDLTKLIGGEVFWDEIEDAIRNHSAKVIAVLSRSAQKKNGFLDEISLAVNIERANDLGAFVIPLRIDNLPFNEVKVNIHRKNVIDFTPDWAAGLNRVLKVLDRDSVPRESTPTTGGSDAWFENMVRSNAQFVNEPDPLLSNQIEVLALPETLNFYRVPIPKNRIRARFSSFAYPVHPFADMVATFAELENINHHLGQFQRATKGPKISVQSIVEDMPHSLPSLKRREGMNILSLLFRVGWDKAMDSRGLLSYTMANGKLAWFFKQGYAEGDWVRFKDLNGKERRKRLVGISKKRNVHWHFAIEAYPLIGKGSRFLLRPHVIFTEDGAIPISSTAHMHRLRRGFCKNWFNKQWRDLMLAYITQLARNEDIITIPLGDAVSFELAVWPQIFEAPFSLDTERAVESAEADDKSQDFDAIADQIGIWAEYSEDDFDDELEYVQDDEESTA